MINVAFVRGAYLNNFEGQNYMFGGNIRLHGFSSRKAIHRSFPFPVTRLMSLTDLPVWDKGLRYVSNRVLGDSQILFGLEAYAGTFDIYHTADPHYYYSYQLARLRDAGKIRKLLVTSWETIPHNNESVPAKKKIKRFVLRQADHFLAYTEKAREALLAEGVEACKITVIPLGVNLTAFKPKKHVDKKVVTYLFVGRLVPEKGILDIYQAYRQIASKHNRLLIVGSGPLRSPLEELIERDGLVNQVTIEEKQYEDMPKVYTDADVFVLPSKCTATWEEQYGMVLVEAMASGLPVVAYDTGAIGEVVGEAGFLIRENDSQTLLETLQRLSDWRLRSKVGTMGKDRAANRYDAHQTAIRLANLYQRI